MPAEEMKAQRLPYQKEGAVNRRILIVDDNPDVHQDFSAAFANEQSLWPSPPFELDAASHGQQALAMLQRALDEDRPYAVAFIDLRLPPGWDGLETIRRLWQCDQRLQVVLCITSLDARWSDIARYLERPDRLLILRKPFDAIEAHQMACTLAAKWQMTEDSLSRIHSLEQAVEDRAKELVEMSHLLQHDPLTDLPNSSLIPDRLSQAIATARRHRKQLAVVFAGLDRFDRISHALGSATSNELLKLIAQQLQGTIRRSDSLFRVGSDVFVLLLTDVSHPKQTTVIAEKLLKAFREPQDVAGHSLSVTASLGISIYPDDGEEVDVLLKKSEVAMHSAKVQGPDLFRYFITGINQQAREMQSIESALHHALLQSELVVYYQPKIELATGALIGAEALLRWRQPERGFISPAQFVPIAEDSGLIVPISRWVLHQACQQARAWQDAGLPLLTMAVNISAVEFRHKHFVDNIKAVLAETGLAPHSLELEITERVLMLDVASTLSILQTLKEMGVRLAIDDFGTGYSSLSYLKRFSVDALKIDQSFVRDISTDSNDAALVDAIINMGHSLNLRITAEGVETREQLDFLCRQGCDEGQGFYFAQAMAPEDFVSAWREDARHCCCQKG
ncbi:EAL domain-containing protein [Gallaecimonas kandeliae]|nr:EAL domain-containing protein [Gallaecimonas kandeliae]WKE67432.1 EAL domain-containing protein [Gallaecimonas kandeliae]